MFTRRRKLILIGLLLLVIVTAFSATGIAFAQASPNFDLACWSIFSAGGGATYSDSYTMVSALGQWYGATAVPNLNDPSRKTVLLSGYIQDWDLLDRPPAPGADPPPPGQFIQAYLPWVSQFAQTLRNCPSDGELAR